MGEMKKPMYVRVPLIVGYTVSDENLTAIAELVAKYPSVERVDLIPFHNYAIHKYEILGKPHILDSLEPLSHEKIDEARLIFEKKGINVQEGG